jgi:hypothetical protein
MIPIEQPAPDLEPCAHCRRLTTLWTALPDRQPAEQVALCRPCSKTLQPKDVPLKADWFAQYKV